jgi:hypothetical protein
MTLLATLLLVACITLTTTPTQTATSNSATLLPVTRTIPTTTPAQTTASNAAEEGEIRDMVDDFGKRLQAVSLQSPDAVQEIQKQYSEFVSPALLEIWMSDVSKAPGRIVSSPWPDRIEITNLLKEGPDRYEVTGFLIEITSWEAVNGGAAAKIPVRLLVQRGNGLWLIIEYSEEQPSAV